MCASTRLSPCETEAPLHTPQPGQHHTQAVAPARVAAPTDTLAALHQLALDVVSRPALDQVLAQALRTAAQITSSSHATLLLLNAAEQICYRVALDNGNLAPLALVAQPMMRRGLAGWVARERRATIVRDTATDERWLPGPGLGDLRSAAAVPVVYGEQVLGILTLGHEAPDQYTAEQLNVLEIIGAHIAMAVELAEYTGVSPRPAAPPRTSEMVVLAARLAGPGAAAPAGFAGLAGPFVHAALELAAQHGGTVAAAGGDTVLVAFPADGGARRAVAFAAELAAATQRLLASWPARPPLPSGLLHIGIGDGPLTLGTLPTGPPAPHARGPAAERARRLCGLARGDVLVAQGVARALEGEPALVLRALPPLRLEHSLLPIYHVSWREAASQAGARPPHPLDTVE